MYYTVSTCEVATGCQSAFSKHQSEMMCVFILMLNLLQYTLLHGLKSLNMEWKEHFQCF